MPGYENLDSDPSSVADKFVDFWQIDALYAHASVAEIIMIHSLSYLRQWQAKDFLARAFQVLAPEGRLIIELPDLGKCARRICASEGDVASHIEAVRAVYAFDRYLELNRSEYPTYAFGWSGWHLKKVLDDIGFHDVKVCDPETHGQLNWRDVRMIATK